MENLDPTVPENRDTTSPYAVLTVNDPAMRAFNAGNKAMPGLSAPATVAAALSEALRVTGIQPKLVR